MWSFVRACTHYVTFANYEVPVPHQVCQKDPLCLCARVSLCVWGLCIRHTQRRVPQTMLFKPPAQRNEPYKLLTHKIPWHSHFGGFLAATHTVLGSLFRVALQITLSLTRRSVALFYDHSPWVCRFLTGFIYHHWRWVVAVSVPKG